MCLASCGPKTCSSYVQITEFAVLIYAATAWCTCQVFHGCVYFLKKKYCGNKRFPVTSNLRYMHGVLNVDEIKN
jgi:hypothetical protein